MIDNLEKANLKNIVLKALEDFGDLQVNLSSPNAREVIAVRIASDILNAKHEYPVSPDEIQKK